MVEEEFLYASLTVDKHDAKRITVSPDGRWVLLLDPNQTTQSVVKTWSLLHPEEEIPPTYSPKTKLPADPICATRNSRYRCTPYLQYRLNRQSNQLQIYVSLDAQKLIQTMKQDRLEDRKLLFQILHHRLSQARNSYCDEMCRRLKEMKMERHIPSFHLATSRLLDSRCLDWMITIEQEPASYLYLEENRGLLDQYEIDTYRGAIRDRVAPKEVSFQSGIVVDLSQGAWIEAFDQLISWSSGVENMKGLVPSSVSLLVCSPLTFNILKRSGMKGLYVNTVNRLHQISYEELLQSRVLIITLHVLKKGYYQNLLDKYQLHPETTFSEVVDIVREQFSLHGWNQMVQNQNLNLSLVSWRRIILDEELSLSLLSQPQIREIVQSLATHKRWILLHHQPDPAQLQEWIKLISTDPQMQFPLYRRENKQLSPEILEGVVWVNQAPETREITRRVVPVKMEMEVKKIYQHLLPELSEYLHENREFLRAYRSLSELVQKMLWSNRYQALDQSSFECPICLRESSCYLVTRCRHRLCVACSLKNTALRAHCPICRTKIDAGDLACPVGRPNKLQRIKKYLAPQGTTLVYSSILPQKELLVDLFPKHEVILAKNKLPIKNSRSPRCIFLAPSESKLAVSIKGVKTVIFLDLAKNCFHSEDRRLLGFDYWSEQKVPKVIYLTYDDSLEQELAQILK